MPHLIDFAELAHELSVSQGAIRKWTAEGWLPCIKVGRTVRYNLAEVMEAVRQRQEPPTSGSEFLTDSAEDRPATPS